MANYMTEFSPDNDSHVYQVKDKEAAPITLLKDTVGWVGKNLAEKTVVTGNLPQYNIQLYIDGELEADKEYKLSFVSDGAYKLYTNEALFTSNASFTTVVGQNEVSVTTKSAISKSTSGQYENNLGWRVLKNGATLTTAPTLTNIMLRDASIADDTYEPYHESVEQCKFDRAEQRVLGAKNFLNTNIIDGGANLATITDGGKTIRVNNTTAGTYQMLKLKVPVVKNTDYILTSVIAYTSGNGRIQISDESNVAIVTSNDYTANANVKLSFNSGNNSFVFIKMASTTEPSAVGDVTYSNTMLRIASDPDDTYAPYAMTNRELTELATVKESAVTDIISGASVGEAGNHLIKVGKVVTLTLRLNSVTITAWGDDMCLIPQDYRPKYNLRTSNMFANSVQVLQINSSGSVKSTLDLNNATVYIHTTWITD